MAISRKPYLLRAMLQWAEDNGWTPLVVVTATHPGVRVPLSHVKDGQITLNVSLQAMPQRELGNERLQGQARFGGRSELLDIPMAAISALIVRETGEGMAFPEELADAPDPDDHDPDRSPPPVRGKPQLKLVK